MAISLPFRTIFLTTHFFLHGDLFRVTVSSAMLVRVVIAVIGILFLGLAIKTKYAYQAPATRAELLAIASADDPKVATLANDPLRGAPKEEDELVIYLPECTGCTVDDPIPDPLPSEMKGAIFVKRTSADLPPSMATERVLIDKDGSIQRQLNANKLPRIYAFKNKRLRDWQKLDETLGTFLGRN